MNFHSLSLDNISLLENIGTALWTQTGNADVSQNVSKFRIGYEIFQRLSGQRELDSLRNQTIMRIAKWIRDHPGASKEEIIGQIHGQIISFSQEIDRM